MASRQAHEVAAVANLHAAELLARELTDAVVWAPTAYFYAAVQVVESKLATLQYHSVTHGDRLAQMARHFDPEVRTAYQILKNLSQDWRYDGIRPDEQAIDKARLQFEQLHRALG